MTTRTVAVVAVGLAALYLSLVVGVVACGWTGGEGPSPHHQHAHAHSAFCAWACQANPSISLLSDAPQAVALYVATPSILFATVLQSASPVRRLGTRAPPC